MSEAKSRSRWQRVKELFDRAVEAEPAERHRLLNHSDPIGGETRREVERMLAADGEQLDLIGSLSAAAVGLLRDQSFQALATGSVLEGRFEIIRLIGRGGMGEVYAAKDRLGPDVAIKIIRPAMRIEADARGRFRQEVQLAQRVSHPNVCRIHAMFESLIDDQESMEGRKLVFLTMELLEGITLKDHLRVNGPVGQSEALPLARQMAEALAAAHTEGVVHRDFKSGNVMLTRGRGGDTRIKITDFGLAAEIAVGGLADEHLAPAGTPDYMAPEQLLGQPASFRADIFAFGVVLHEMITGKLPFKPLNSITEARQRWHPAAPRFPAILAASLPRFWESAIRRCLDPDPGRRPTSPGEVLDILEGKSWRWTRRLIMLGGTLAVSGGLTARYGADWARTIFFASPVGSVAVLPFTDESADKQFGHLTSGLTDELIGTLATVPNLRVVARNSVNRYQGATAVDGKEAARTLGVQAVLSGRVRREGDLMRVSAQLTNGADGTQLWAQTYDHPASAGATLPSRMSSAIATALRLRLASAAGGGSLRAHSTVPRAYELYLLGRQSLAKSTVNGMEEAIGHFEEATALDGRYALAWAGLAEASHLLAGRSGFPPNEWFPKVERAARRAIELDPHLAEAHLSLGTIYQRYYWDWDQAERHFQLAVQVAPGLAQAHHRYAGFLSNLGYHARALGHIREARELDPLSLSINNAYGAFLQRAGKLDEAILQLQLVNKLDPKYQSPYTFLGLAYEGKGMWDEAIAHHRRAKELDPDDLTADADLAFALARGGRTEEAKQIAERLKLNSAVPPSSIADVYKGLGDKDRAFQWLEKAYAARDTYLMTLRIDRRNDILRGDPRFAELATRLRLP